jgi:hypothetical protein
VVLFSTSCDPKYGFMESDFRLAADSRLPKWFSIPPGLERKDLMLKINFYSSPSGSKVKMTLYGPPPERKELAEKAGTKRWHPLTEEKLKEKSTRLNYPEYSIITVDGQEEVFEQKGREDILYITDDPKTTSGYSK